MPEILSSRVGEKPGTPLGPPLDMKGKQVAPTASRVFAELEIA